MTTLQKSTAEVFAEMMIASTGGRKDTQDFIVDRLTNSDTLIGMMQLLVSLNFLLKAAHDIAYGETEEQGDSSNEQ